MGFLPRRRSAPTPSLNLLSASAKGLSSRLGVSPPFDHIPMQASFAPSLTKRLVWFCSFASRTITNSFRARKSNKLESVRIAVHLFEVFPFDVGRSYRSGLTPCSVNPVALPTVAEQFSRRAISLVRGAYVCSESFEYLSVTSSRVCPSILWRLTMSPPRRRKCVAK